MKNRKSKKPTRLEKIEITSKGICWKCGGELTKNKAVLKCLDCDFKLLKN